MKLPVNLEILPEKLATGLLSCVEMKVDEKFFGTLEYEDVVQLSLDICIGIPQAIEQLLKYLQENEKGTRTLTFILAQLIANSCLHKLDKDAEISTPNDTTNVVH